MCTLPSSPNEVAMAVRETQVGIHIHPVTFEEEQRAVHAATVALAVIQHAALAAHSQGLTTMDNTDKPMGSMERPSNVARVMAQGLAAVAAGKILAENVPALAPDGAHLRDYLSWHDTRNVQGHKAITRFLNRALGHPKDLKVVVGHHITYQVDEESVPNEIPSADSLLFDHDIMHLVFGDEYKTIMVQLATRVPELRERVLSNHLDMLDRRDGLTPPVTYERTETMRFQAAHLSDGRPNPIAADSRAE